MRVLIVDDSQLMRKVLTGAVKRMGVEHIIEATNGEEAIDAVDSISDPIDLILIDSLMPVMNGLSAIKKLRQDGVKIPIIMVSIEGEKSKVIEAINAGADDYLIKPFTAKDINHKLEKYLIQDTV